MRYARGVAIVFLAFLGISSIAGAVPLILDPSGGLLRMPSSFLQHSPFRSFLIPGIILMVANGLLSLAILVAVIRKVNGYGRWVAFQGCVIFGWITVEVLMIRLVHWAHFVYWGVGIVLFVAGLAIMRSRPPASRQS